MGDSDGRWRWEIDMEDSDRREKRWKTEMGYKDVRQRWGTRC